MPVGPRLRFRQDEVGSEHRNGESDGVGKS
jgi:hypothetical protein